MNTSLVASRREHPDLAILPCEIGRETYALDMSWVRTIGRLDRASVTRTEPPVGPDEESRPVGRESRRIGSLIVEKTEAPLYLLSELLGRTDSGPQPDVQARSQEEPQRAIVLRLEPPWALVVDRVGRPFSVHAESVVALPEVAADPDRDVFDGVVFAETRILLLLAPDRLIARARRETPWPTKGPADGSRAARKPWVGERDRGTPDQALATPRRLVRFWLPQHAEMTPACAFALSLSQVPEVLEVPPVIPVPFAPAYICGLIRWRDHVVPVIDLSRRLGLPHAAEDPSEKTRLIIARGAGSRIGASPGGAGSGRSGRRSRELWGGFVVRSDVQIAPVPPARRMSANSVPLVPEMTSGVFDGPEGCLVIPDLRTVLTQSAGS